MATVHLVHGYLGAGKTTFARSLAQRESALCISVDEWYLRLFANPPTYDIDRQKLERLLGVLNEHWPQVVAQGLDVVLDFGFWRRALRDDARTLARRAGAEIRLHWVRCTDAVALRRCLDRNGALDAFLISESGFQELKVRFEPLELDEPFEVVETG